MGVILLGRVHKYGLADDRDSVCSLVGVVLIARPQFIFGSPSHAAVPDLANALDEAIIPATTTTGQRLGAVGYAVSEHLVVSVLVIILTLAQSCDDRRFRWHRSL